MDRRTLLQTALAVPFAGIGDKVFGNSKKETTQTWKYNDHVTSVTRIVTKSNIYSPFNTSLGKMDKLSIKKNPIKGEDPLLSSFYLINIEAQYEKGQEVFWTVMKRDDKEKIQNVLYTQPTELFNKHWLSMGYPALMLQDEFFYLESLTVSGAFAEDSYKI